MSSISAIENRILEIRGIKVIVDSDLAYLFGVPTKRLNERVKRNRAWLPSDFVFNLTQEEKLEVVAKCDHLSRMKYTPSLPNAFTKNGAIMAASVFNSDAAVQLSIVVGEHS